MNPTAGFPPQLASVVLPPVRAARDFLLGLQNPLGFWVGELEADTTLESDYILLEFFLGTARPEKIRKAANYILSRQLPEGGWSIYAGGPANAGATVKAYLALKLAGFHPEEHFMRRAREAALALEQTFVPVDHAIVAIVDGVSITPAKERHGF